MSILIKNITKPKDCLDCPMCNSNDDCVLQDERFDTWDEQMRGCPITDISDTNDGDIINRQAAIDALDCINGAEEVLRSLPSAQPDTPMRGSKVAETAGNITDRTTGDCISRQAAKDYIDTQAKRVFRDSLGGGDWNEKSHELQTSV